MGKITTKELVRKYRRFFERKDHKWIPSSPLIPEGDSSTLFISAGMHPLVPYLLGEPHPLGKRLVDVQECLRTDDIDEVGDTFHHTWFEMLGNWSLGDYFKKESLAWSFEFLTRDLGLDSRQISVTCFAGDKDAPRDYESAAIWKSLGIPEKRIFFNSKEDNWWGPVGEVGPCGPDSEIFIDTGKRKCSSKCAPGCFCGKYCEIWNNVFMEYNKKIRTEDFKIKSKSEEKSKYQYVLLKQKNVDTGMGVERTLAILNGVDDDYLTDVWQPIIKKIEQISGKKYQGENLRPMRIIADHLRAAVFVVAAGVLPGNKTQGYVLRRLIRRSVRQGKLLGIKDNFVSEIVRAVFDNFDNFAGDYKEVLKNDEEILTVLVEEEKRFLNTLNLGLREFRKFKEKRKIMTGILGWNLYQSFGFPPELTKEEAVKEKIKLSSDFDKQFLLAQKKHQELSHKSTEKLFKGGLGEQNDKTIKYHTATHLLQAALRVVLGDHVRQTGSAITSEKMRFDFTHNSPLDKGQIAEVELLVNKKIAENLLVKVEVMSFKKALKIGALFVPEKKYPSEVKVYSIGNFSKEVCGGPHVKTTGMLGKFKIEKEESCGSGKRRIYAILK